MESIGFGSSIWDQCLSISDKVVCLVYVDNICFAENEDDITKAFDKLIAAGMDLEVENVAGFLGVHIDHQKDGSIHLTRTALIDHLLKALYLPEKP